MHFEFRTAATGGLRVIPSIPDPQICVIEGYNGIGKTMAIRLLELCAGGQPYTGPRSSMAWSTLRSDLGEALIVAEGLRGANRIEWQVDSTSWPPVPSIPDDSWIGKITVDGRPARLADVRQLLDVRRIAGDVTLVETLAQRTDSYATAVGALRERMLSPTGTTHRALDLLGEIEGAARRSDPTSLRHAQEALASARGAAQEAAELLSRQTERLALLQEAEQTKRMLDEMTTLAPKLDAEIELVDSDLEAAEDLRERLSADLRQAEIQQAASDNVARQLKNALRTADRNRKRLEAVQEQVAEALASAHLSEFPDVVSEIGLQHERIDELMRQRADIDATPLLRELLSDLLDRLTSAQDAGLGNQTLFEDEADGRIFTIEKVSNSIAAAKERLPEAGSASSATESLDAEIRRQTGRLNAVRQLRDLGPERERLQRLTAQAEARIEELTAGPEADSAKFNQLRQELRDAEARVVELATRRVLLRRQRDEISAGHDPNSLPGRLENLLEQAETDETSLGSDLQAADLRGRELAQRLTELRAVEQESGAQLANTRADIRRAVSLLADADDFVYLRRSGIPLPDPMDPEELQAGRLAEILERARMAQDSLQDVPNRLASMESALASVASTLRGKTPAGEQYVPQLRRWLERQFGEWFESETVRRVLIPAASSITVDLSRQALVWRDATGGGGARPFDAFSSGEQAFAYTRAQLEVLPDTLAANRLIALDEFGAFVAHNRRADLRRLLEQRAASHPEEKTVLILPVTQDYEELARSTVGDDSRAHERRADALRQDEYFAEQFA